MFPLIQSLMQLFLTTLIAVRPVFNSSNEQEMVTFASEEARTSTANVNLSSSESFSYESIDTKFDAPLVQGEITRSPTAESSQTSTALVNTNQNGIPIFQGYLLSEPTCM